MLFWPSVKTHRIVPLAAATAVGVEMAKFDWRIRASVTAACANRRTRLPHDQMQENQPALALGSYSIFVRRSRLFSATTTVLASGSATSAEAPA